MGRLPNAPHTALPAPALSSPGSRPYRFRLPWPRRSAPSSTTSASISSTARWAPCCTPRAFFLNVCYDELALKQPALVREVHEAYVRAGAEILETNTFGANPIKLGASRARRAKPSRSTRSAAELARTRRERSRVGRRGDRPARPAPRAVRPDDRATRPRDQFRRQVDGLLAGGVDGFVLETFSDLEEIHAALRAVREAVRSSRGRADDDRHRRPHRLRHRRRRTSPVSWSDGARTSSASTARWARRACSRPSSGWRRPPIGRFRRSPTPGFPRTSGTARSTWRAPSTWRATRAASSKPGPGSWADAAARRPSTSARCATT